jgi:hypothetical protein
VVLLALLLLLLVLPLLPPLPYWRPRPLSRSRSPACVQIAPPKIKARKTDAEIKRAGAGDNCRVWAEMDLIWRNCGAPELSFAMRTHLPSKVDKKNVWRL